MNENMEFPGVSGDDIEWLQNSFVQAIKVRELLSFRNVIKICFTSLYIV